MTQHAHTPGPYTKELHESDNRWHIIGPRGQELAIVTGETGKLAANAGLFAESPAMLEACEQLLSYRDRAGAINFQLEKADDYLRAIRTVIARVKGEKRYCKCIGDIGNGTQI